MTGNQNPKWIHSYLTEQEIIDISKTVLEQEKHTTGEIVPMIVRSSSYTGQIPFILNLIFVALILLSDLYFRYEIIYVFAFLILSVFVTLWLSKKHWIQKLLIPDIDEMAQVQQLAELEFYRNSVHKTKAKTGILIFVSVMERKAVILADEGIAKRLPSDLWSKILHELLKDLHGNHWGPGLIRAIQQCGALLKEHYPAEVVNQNELANRLIIK